MDQGKFGKVPTSGGSGSGTRIGNTGPDAWRRPGGVRAGKSQSFRATRQVGRPAARTLQSPSPPRSGQGRRGCPSLPLAASRPRSGESPRAAGPVLTPRARAPQAGRVLRCAAVGRRVWTPGRLPGAGAMNQPRDGRRGAGVTGKSRGRA